MCTVQRKCAAVAHCNTCHVQQHHALIFRQLREAQDGGGGRHPVQPGPHLEAPLSEPAAAERRQGPQEHSWSLQVGLETYTVTAEIGHLLCARSCSTNKAEVAYASLLETAICDGRLPHSLPAQTCLPLLMQHSHACQSKLSWLLGCELLPIYLRANCALHVH